MSSPPASLDQARVARIFGRLAVRYGSIFTGRWVGLDMDDVRADWGRELGGLTDDALAYGLQHLPPEFPPTATQFRDACARAPQRYAALPAPYVPPPAEIIERLNGIGNPRSPVGMTLAQQCAANLRRKLADGDRLTLAQKEVLKACESIGDAVA